MTQPTDQPGACLLDACTRQCTTECRDAINRAWHSLCGQQPVQSTDRPGIDQLTSDQLDQLYAERDHAVRVARSAARDAAKALNDQLAAEERAERAEATLTAIRARHERNPEADYCALCSNHGDITWPCATMAVLDQHGQTRSGEGR
ncbi:hypothetical protein [Streptomyces sp. NPDC056169]|uniref:hypothetical protein n=1 Tax=Streptomyces sp. NPDC056169 TaxID=3345734 RepID=UPI0035D7EBBA